MAYKHHHHHIHSHARTHKHTYLGMHAQTHTHAHTHAHTHTCTCTPIVSTHPNPHSPPPPPTHPQTHMYTLLLWPHTQQTSKPEHKRLQHSTYSKCLRACTACRDCHTYTVVGDSNAGTVASVEMGNVSLDLRMAGQRFTYGQDILPLQNTSSNVCRYT